MDVTARYIANQAEHHRKRSCRAELMMMRERHGLKFDERSLG